MRPRIGILPCLDATRTLRAGRRTFYLDGEYVAAVEDAGGAAVVLPAQRDAATLLGGVAGLLVPGGDDFPPPRPYPADVAFTPLAEEQVAFDRALLGEALRRGIPTLGICYGMQLLALASGGALHHHLPVDLPRADDHGGAGRSTQHPVRVEAGSRLAELLGTGELSVLSRHHQGVASVGPGLRVCARAPDGVIEALEPAAPDAPFLLAVQWHPEAMDAGHRRRLFGALVRAAAA